MHALSFGTPIGPITVSGDQALSRLHFADHRGAARLPALEAARDQVLAYFEGQRRVFDLPLDLPADPFRRKFLAALQAIPFGQTRSYGDLAAALGVSAQAIGQACGANPIPLIIPCHRVLAAQGLGGYSGAGGIETKVALLKHEGAASLLI